MSETSGDPELWFAYDRPVSFSGQSGASELMIEGLRANGWTCRVVHFPALNRAIRNVIVRYIVYLSAVAVASASLLRIVLRRNAALHLSLGQSLAAFIKAGPALMLIAALRPAQRRIVSLHGSIFMDWTREQREAKIFRMLLSRATYITVLGEQQRAGLANLGVPLEKIRVVRNTCEFDAVSEASVRAKHAVSHDSVNVLHLSLLIESKGYPEFLEALDIVGRTSAVAIDATLCGPLSFSAFCRRFTDEPTKEAWIVEMIDRISQHENVEARWIRGAAGEEKRRLLEAAEIFVFPSTFPVEAQPLVLLEAMANGCAIVSSSVGEIPSTLDSSCAILLDDPTSAHVADALNALLTDPARRLDLGLAARRRFEERFSRPAYISRWQDIFRGATEVRV